jgi:hypothetical protein
MTRRVTQCNWFPGFKNSFRDDHDAFETILIIRSWTDPVSVVRAYQEELARFGTFTKASLYRHCEIVKSRSYIKGAGVD